MGYKNHTLGGPSKPIINVSLALFHEVPAGAIERLFDEQNQPLLKRVDLGKSLGVTNIRDNFKESSSHYTCPRSEIEVVGQTETFRESKTSS